MFKNLTIANYLQEVLTVLIMTLPPWIAMVSNMKKKVLKKRRKLVLVFFVLYIFISSFTNNILPTLFTIIYLFYVFTDKNDVKEKYYLRPLEKKTYKFNFRGNKNTIIVAKDRIAIIINSIIFRIVVTVIGFWFIVFLSSKGIEIEDQTIVEEFVNASIIKSIYLVILIIITAPILEEFIFRHLFYRLFSVKVGKVISGIVISILFAFFHYHLEGIITFFLLGIYSCYLYERYGYRACVLNHFVFNLISLGYMLYLKIL